MHGGVIPKHGGLIGGVLLLAVSVNWDGVCATPFLDGMRNLQFRGATTPRGAAIKVGGMYGADGVCNGCMPGATGLCGARNGRRMRRDSVVGWKQNQPSNGHLDVGAQLGNNVNQMGSNGLSHTSYTYTKIGGRSASDPGLGRKKWGGELPTPILDRSRPTASVGHGCVARAAPRDAHMCTWP